MSVPRDKWRCCEGANKKRNRGVDSTFKVAEGEDGVLSQWHYRGDVGGAYERKSWPLLEVVPTTVFFPAAPRHMAAAIALGPQRHVSASIQFTSRRYHDWMGVCFHTAGKRY